MLYKTATVTWISYPNYGTYLQAYALQQVLLSLHCTNAIIDDSRIINSHHKKTLRMRLGLIRNTILERLCLKSPPSPNRHIPYYERFKKKNLFIDSDWKDLDALSNTYDIFVCGSDQIWSPYLEFEPFYFLGFTDKKKIAYAPSTGTGVCDKKYIDNVSPLLKTFNHIAVREEDGARMLSSFIKKDIKVVLDPTLLLDRGDWNNVEESIMEDRPYVLCYFLTPNSWYLKYAKEYGKKHNICIKVLDTNPVFQDYGLDTLVAGPGEFLSYIKNASIVFTDSFHASIFSIIYHKTFVTFKRFRDGGKNDQNARIANLFAKIGLSSRFIGESELLQIEQMDGIPYDKVDGCLETLRQASKDYLKNALEK